ncbi:HypC/HybG/HupF family hydrogenase formation chaperone [Insolitispirillum peregrinum]|uniref:Hydrogenase maturation factor HypC n=1 Tax=Insolitispirillum peregrinum TaxID=80876 RepID=A0A1N7P9X7_9PROT|nr:HypC/HybG/HupF family hydrogenase formation chaperone [Insolitispirillum peregrinum]SIT07327.1 Hydrogenase maturation protein HypC [Insolitispirillum peregrinum]
MCLAVPAQVVALLPDGMATVDVAGVKKDVSVALVDGLAVGDYVILHVGYALNRIDADEAARTLALLAEIGQLDEARQELLDGGAA